VAAASNQRAMVALVQRGEIGDHILSLLGVFKAGESHEGPRHNLARSREVTVQGANCPGKAGVSVGIGVVETGNLAGVPVNHAKQAGTDEISPRPHCMAYATIVFENTLAGRNVLGQAMMDSQEHQDDDATGRT
jgi:hypothetical protein